jgi:hypothetical protein
MRSCLQPLWLVHCDVPHVFRTVDAAPTQTYPRALTMLQPFFLGRIQSVVTCAAMTCVAVDMVCV